MISKELMAKIRQIEITTSRLVESVFAGEYHSVFKGKGIEFDEVREYVHGDDVRDIDWNVTAKTGVPHTKKFTEEREMTVFFVVDVSASEQFGTVVRTKAEVVAEICALLAFSAIKNNDRVGVLFFTDRVEKYIPPKKGKQHVLRVIREILNFKPKGKRTDLNVALRSLNEIVRKRSTVFLVSDFMAGDYERLLKISYKKHDVVAIVVEDPRELEFPRVGLIRLEDAETGEEISFNSNVKGFGARFNRTAAAACEKRQKAFDAIGMDHIDLRTDAAYADPLIKFFKQRARRKRWA